MKKTLLALISLACALNAQRPLVKMQPTALPQIVNPNFEGLEVVLSGVPSMFLVVNRTKHDIVGLSIWYRDVMPNAANPKGKGSHHILDGLDTSYRGIAAGGNEVFTYSLQTKAILLDWVLFSDGSFYGSEKDLAKINLKSKVRREFFKGLQEAPSWGNYVVKLEECGRDINCAKASGRPALEWNEINKAIRYVHSNLAYLGDDRFRSVIPRIVAQHNKYPTARMVKKKSELRPLSQDDGWEFLSFVGTCNALAGPTQTGYVGGDGMTTWLTSVSNIWDTCKYDVQWDPNSTGTPPSGVVPGLPMLGWVPRATSYALGVFDAHVTGQCFNVDTGGNFNLTEGAQFGLPKTADIALQIYGVGDPKYYPRYAAQTFIGNNWSSSWNGGTLYFSLAFGYPEPFGPTANDDGGQTFTSVLFLAPWGEFSDVSGGALLGLGDGYKNPATDNPSTPSVSVNLNYDRTTAAAWTNKGFGFFLQNFETNTECTDPGNPDINPAINTELRITTSDDKVISTFNTTRTIANPGAIVTLVGHKPAQQTAGNGNGDSCTGINPFQDCCCCLKAGYGIDYCQSLCGLEGAISCDLTTGATAGGKVQINHAAPRKGVTPRAQ